MDEVTVTLHSSEASILAFLLGESYFKWGEELDHYLRHEDVYPGEVLQMLDVMDKVRDQLVEQGVEWDPSERVDINE